MNIILTIIKMFDKIGKYFCVLNNIMVCILKQHHLLKKLKIKIS